MSIASLNREARRALMRMDADVRKNLTMGYRASWDRIEQRLAEIQRRLMEEPNSIRRPGLLAERWRLLELASQIQAEASSFGRIASGGIVAHVPPIIRQAQQDATRQLFEVLGPTPPEFSFAPVLPVPELELLGRNMQDGQPLGDLIARAAPTTAQAVKDVLLSGLATGQNPRVVAARMRAAGSIPLQRALVIARTEMLRVYRTTTLDVYRANQGLVKGWEWMSALDRRTCAICWSMHGTYHTLDEQLDTHPACRCTSIPVTKTWKELGFEGMPDTSVRLESGESEFAKLDMADQRHILGPARFKMYQNGVLKFSDLSARTEHPLWGGGRRARNLTEIGRSASRRSFSMPNLPGIAGIAIHFAGVSAAVLLGAQTQAQATPAPIIWPEVQTPLTERGQKFVNTGIDWLRHRGFDIPFVPILAISKEEMGKLANDAVVACALNDRVFVRESILKELEKNAIHVSGDARAPYSTYATHILLHELLHEVTGAKEWRKGFDSPDGWNPTDFEWEEKIVDSVAMDYWQGYLKATGLKKVTSWDASYESSYNAIDVRRISEAATGKPAKSLAAKRWRLRLLKSSFVDRRRIFAEANDRIKARAKV